MAVYKFRITFEDYDEVSRDIEIKSNQTFEDFHYAIHQSIGFDGKSPSSFYMSNDQWHKGKEITLFKDTVRNPEKTSLMADSVLKSFIIDPHQKIYYIFNLDRPWTFYIQLVKITINEDPKIKYPVCIKVDGEAPKQFGNTPIIPTVANEDLDFLNQFELGEEDEEEVEGMGFDDGAEAEEEQEETNSEFGAEFDDEFKQEDL